jgi:hypothetical protein
MINVILNSPQASEESLYYPETARFFAMLRMTQGFSAKHHRQVMILQAGQENCTDFISSSPRRQIWLKMYVLFSTALIEFRFSPQT